MWEIVKEECKYLHDSINLFIKYKLPYSSINYMFIEKVAWAETIQIIDRYTAEKSTLQVNNTTSTKTKSTLHKKIIFKD